MSQEILLKITQSGLYVISECNNIKNEKAVSLDEVGSVFNKLISARSPLLTNGTSMLGYMTKQGLERYLLWDSPRIRNLRVSNPGGDDSKDLFLTVPTPGVILDVTYNFKGNHLVNSSLYAYKDLIVTENTPLFMYPSLNIYEGVRSKICWGELKIKKGDIGNLINLFFGSRFNQDLNGTLGRNVKVFDVWRKLDREKAEEFPNELLQSINKNLLSLYKEPIRNCDN